jgi:glutathione peroxidase-family protein
MQKFEESGRDSEISAFCQSNFEEEFYKTTTTNY